MKPSAGSALCGNSLTVFSISPWETGLLKVSVSNEVNRVNCLSLGYCPVHLGFQIYLYTPTNNSFKENCFSSDFSLLFLMLYVCAFPFFD